MHFLTPSPSCPRSYWMAPYKNRPFKVSLWINSRLDPTLSDPKTPHSGLSCHKLSRISYDLVFLRSLMFSRPAIKTSRFDPGCPAQAVNKYRYLALSTCQQNNLFGMWSNLWAALLYYNNDCAANFIWASQKLHHGKFETFFSTKAKRWIPFLGKMCTEDF